MHKRSLLALILVMAMLFTSGCSLIVKDEEVDRATVIVEVGDRTITKGLVQQQADYLMDYNEYQFSQYGLPYDKTDAKNIASAQDEAITSLIASTVVDIKRDEMGLNTLSEEKEAELAAQATEDFKLYYDSIEMFYFSGTELTGEELEAAVLAEMANMGYPTSEENLLESLRLNAMQEALYNEIIKDVVVTDEDVAAEYQARVDADRAAYEGAPSGYGTAVSEGSSPYYVPAGYRYVKHILLQLSAEDQETINAIQTELSAKKGEKARDPEADVDAIIASLEEQLAAATETAYANLQPKADEVYAKLAEGVTFEELIDEYDEDPGMSGDSVGYPVCAESTNWVAEFQEGAMALANVGDVSAEPVRTSYGLHIIKYDSDIAEGEIGLETVKADIYDELLSAEQEEVYNSTVEQWVNEANAKVYKNRL